MKRRWLPALVLFGALFSFAGIASAGPPSEAPQIPAQFPGAGIEASPRKIATGGVLTIEGAGHPFVCAIDPLTAVVVLWDDTTEIARITALDAGGFTVRVQVPKRASAGPHRISSWCGVAVTEDVLKLQLELADTSVTVVPAAASGERPSSNRPTRVLPTSGVRPNTAGFGGDTFDAPASEGVLQTPNTQPAEQSTPARVVERLRSVFPHSLPSFGEALHSVKQLGITAGFSLLLLILLGFPSELFNNTLEEHHERIFGRLAGLRTRYRRARSTWRRPGREPLRLPAGVGFIGFAIAGGLIYSLLDPELGWNQASFALILGLITALGIGTLAFELPVLLYERRAGSHGRIRALPQAMLAGGGLVLASRLLSFQPGYAYGIVAGYEADDEGLTDEQQGKAVALGAISALTVAVGAWFAFSAIDSKVEDGARFGLLVADAALSALVVSGIQGVAFTLLPVSFMDGATVMKWSRTAWAALQGLAGFALFYIVLRPAGGFVDYSSSTPAVAIFVTFAAFALFSIGFWSYWRRQKARAARWERAFADTGEIEREDVLVGSR
ncbi:MAG TPA: FGLLP motif-containing membrane protein [Actinomycetota bacterium]|jgi:hypothetical protein|nr:FGLLP motif-containing membrane protein [Actinomycetota bacterium]